MRLRTKLALFGAALLASASGAGAQQFQPGEDVIVNPPPPGANGVLLYPGGKYLRVMHPLRQPGEKSGPIRLHLPVHHRLAHALVKKRQVAAALPAEQVPAEQAPVVQAPAAPAPVPHRHKAAPPPPSPAPDSATDLTPTPNDTTFNITEAATPPARPPARTRTARTEPPPAPAQAGESTAGLTKRSVILFAANAPDPAPAALGAIKYLASDLSSALTGASSRIQILAYGGAKGDKGTEARRLSLKRALSIRQVLIGDGVPAERIDVRAMGGADDGGPADRVDVFIRS